MREKTEAVPQIERGERKPPKTGLFFFTSLKREKNKAREDRGGSPPQIPGQLSVHARLKGSYLGDFILGGVALTLQAGRNWSTHTDKVDDFSSPQATQCLATAPRAARAHVCVCVFARLGKLLGL